jgi:hypothetical protein
MEPHTLESQGDVTAPLDITALIEVTHARLAHINLSHLNLAQGEPSSTLPD